MRSSSISHHDSSVLSPLIQRRTSLTAHQHAITISPASPLSATFPSTISTTTLDSAGLSVTSDHADFPSSSPQLKFQQSEWKKKKSDSTLLPHAVPLPKALAWRPKGGIDGRDRRPTSGGGRRAWRICFLLAFVPLSGLVLLLLSSARSSPTSTSSLAASSSRSATSHHAHAVASRVSSWGRLLRSSSRQRKNTLRSPHHTYAFAVPLPNDDPHGAAYEEHPIHGLIREAKEKWEEKKKAQKETCEEAMEEYKRRYGRKVPDGFQHWWYWAKQNKVQLLDDYDQINSAIEPFLSLKPSELRRRLQVLQDDPEDAGRDHTILTLQKGRFSDQRAGGHWRPAIPDGFEFLVKDIAHMLPDMTVALYLHDASHTQIDYEAMQGYRQAAREGRWVNEDELPIAGETKWTNRERTCAPDSDYRRHVQGLDNTFTPPGPAFVRNHSNEMHYCSNPQNLDLHGATSGCVGLRELEPSFALSRTGPDGDLLWPSTIQYDLNPKNESAFREKQDKIVWRGSPDGIYVGRDQKWRQSQRFRLLSLTNSNSTTPRLVRHTALDRWGQEYQHDVETNLQALNERFSDIKATNGPVQCEEELCEYLRETMEFVEKSSLEEMADHKYVMDVDGNAYSARFRTHLLSNQIPFKATIYEEFYTEKIVPWVHYVPVRMDYSDLYNSLTFFSEHEALAEEIAQAGKEWAETHWRTVDMQAFVFRLLLEYGRVMDMAREE